MLSNHIGLPRGCLEDVRQLLTALNIRTVIRDERYGGQPLHVNFQGELRPEQKLAADAILKHETGVLSATTALARRWSPPGSSHNAASTRWSWFIVDNYSINGSSASQGSWIFQQNPSDESAEVERNRAGCSMWGALVKRYMD
jgi:hypothetical protein